VIESLKSELSSLLPLVVREASFADPTLTLAGDGWAFSSTSAWRVTRNGLLLYGWSDPAAPDLVWDLCGQAIMSVSAQSSLMRGDPAFQLSSGNWLEIFSDHPTDPWVLRLPSVTFVGSPTDPAWVQ
jgi:hypothetical protein